MNIDEIRHLYRTDSIEPCHVAFLLNKITQLTQGETAMTTTTQDAEATNTPLAFVPDPDNLGVRHNALGEIRSILGALHQEHGDANEEIGGVHVQMLPVLLSHCAHHLAILDAEIVEKRRLDALARHYSTVPEAVGFLTISAPNVRMLQARPLSGGCMVMSDSGGITYVPGLVVTEIYDPSGRVIGRDLREVGGARTNIYENRGG